MAGRSGGIVLVITGGAGFIGSALLWHLNSLGVEDIVIVDELGAGGKWRNLVKGRYVDYIHKDRFLELLDRKALPFRIDSLVHLGACSDTTETDADYLMENNFRYSQKLCRQVLDQGGRFINASSAATYGAGENGFRDDPQQLPRLRPLNLYAYSKHLFDLWALRQGLLDEFASLKFFNVFGPNEYHKKAMASVACKWHGEIRNTGHATLFASNSAEYGDGEQKRDFIYVKDCVKLIGWLLLEGRKVDGILNVGTGVARSFRDLAKAVFRAMRLTPQITYIPLPPAISSQYQNYTCASMGWLQNAGYPHAFATLEEGIGDYVENYLSTPDPYL